MSQSGSNSGGGGGGNSVTQVSTDVGIAIPIAGNINLLANPNAGRSVFFISSTDTIDLFTTDGNGNTFIGQNAGISGTDATSNVALGFDALTSLNDPAADGNVAVGAGAAALLVSGNLNTIIGKSSSASANGGEAANTTLGYSSLGDGTGCNGVISIGHLSMAIATGVSDCLVIGNQSAPLLTNAGGGRNGNDNVCVGNGSLSSATTANFNCVLGNSSATSLLSGVSNVCVGNGDGGSSYVVAESWTGSETGNIIIQNVGQTGENNTIRIGTQGSGSAQQNRCFVAGITGVTTTNTNMVTIDTTTGQLGSAAVPSSGVVNITGNGGGTATGTTITFNASECGDTALFTGSGSTIEFSVTDGDGTTAWGDGAGGSGGLQNSSFGSTALNALVSGGNNVSIGASSLFSLNSGSNNCALGSEAMSNVTNASSCIAIGRLAGVNFASTETSNIVIGNQGVAADSHVIRIGTQGSGGGQQNTCFVAGISGVTTANTQAVTIDSTTGQLGSRGLTILPNYTAVTASPYVVTATDYYLSVNTATTPKIVQLPNSPTQYSTYVIKDVSGNALLNNISVTTVGGAVTIDGVTTLTMNINYQSIQLVFNGVSYEVF